MAETVDSLHLPRILCLHGGGTNARVFKIQCRAIESALADKYRFAYAEAPYECPAEGDVESVYEGYGPFKRWLRWDEDHDKWDDATMAGHIEGNIKTAMDADDELGATGTWVGILGFSQGARVAASLLLKQQVRAERLGKDKAGSTWKFGVFLAGRAPLVSLDPEVFQSSMLSDPSQIGLSGEPDPEDVESEEHVIRLHTVHMQGRYDPTLDLQQDLLETYCDPDAVRVLEWDAGHRLPVKPADVEPLVDYILDISEESGALAE
ncbi:serine hydrolase FSH [Xylariales sp. PMI_506]|nr:serine hydrolase FSH [Xylariales sp. PMI_506]